MFVITLLACAGADLTGDALEEASPVEDVLPEDPSAVPLPPPGNVTLVSTTWVSGASATVSVDDAEAGSTVAFVFSTQGQGNGPCPAALGGVCFDLASPRLLGTVTADAGGYAELSLVVPSGHDGEVIGLQAAHGGQSPDSSNLVAVTLCASDVDGDGVCDDTGTTGTTADTGPTADTGYPTVDTSLDLPPVAEELVECSVDPEVDLGFTPDVSITELPSTRVIEGNGVPEHMVGEFPSNGTPHSMAEVTVLRRVPLTPSGTGEDMDVNPFAVGTNGVIFAPLSNEWYDNDENSGWRYEPLNAGVLLGLDCNYAHVFPSGQYHYHGMPEGLMDQQGEGPDMYFVGYAGDGYPVYARWGYDDPDDADSPLRPMTTGWQLKEGERPTDPFGEYDGTFVEDYEYVGGGDLDACNGRTGTTPEFGETYHYYVTDGFPFIPRCWSAEPHSSWNN